MPTYIVRDPQSGKTLSLTGDSPPTEAELEQLFASQGGQPATAESPDLLPARPQPVSSITGMTPSEAQARGEAGAARLAENAIETAKATPGAVARYGIPVAAGIATGGMGFLPAAGYGLLAGVGGELAAQGMDVALGRPGARNLEELGREVGASGLVGAVVPIPLRAAGAAAKPVGQAVVNFLTNAGAITAANEAANWLRTGDIKAPKGIEEYLTRFGPAVALSGAGTFISTSVARQEARIARQVEAREALFGAEPALGYVAPGLAEFEAKVYQKGSAKAREVLNNMSVNIGPAIKRELIDGAPNPSDVAKKLIPYVQPLKELRQQAEEATAKATSLAGQAADASASNAIFAAKVAEEANMAAVQAVKTRALAYEGAEKMLGDGITDVSQVATGVRKERMMEMADAAQKSVALGLGQLYDTANLAGSAPVASVDAVRKNIRTMVRNKVHAGEIEEMLDVALKKPGVLTNAGNLTLDGYRSIRDSISEGLVKAGQPRSAAAAKAGQAYHAAQSASDSFIAKVYPEETVNAFRKANKAAAAVYESDAGLIDDLRAGNVKGILELIETEGMGPAVKQIQSYVTALSGTGDDASRAAARQFSRSVAGSIRDHLVDTSLRLGEGIDDAARALDTAKLVRRVDALRQKGMSPEALGFPNAESVQALARVSATPEMPLTKERLQGFFEDVARSGVPVAEARLMYDGTLIRYMTTSKAPESARMVKELNRLADKAQLTATEVNEAYNRAKTDPLVQLFNEPGISVSPNFGANPQYVQRLLSSGADGVRRLREALSQPVRTDVPWSKAAQGPMVSPSIPIQRRQTLENLKSSAIADVFGENFRAAIGPNTQTVRAEQITDFFYGPSQRVEREAFRELIGAKEFTNLENRFVRGLKMELEHRRNLRIPLEDIRPGAQFVIGTGSLLRGQGQSGGYIVANILDRGLRYLQDRAYNAFRYAYVDADTSKDFLKFKGNLDAVFNANPRNRLLYELAVRKDAEAQQEYAQRTGSGQSLDSESLNRLMSQLQGR